MKDLVNGTTNKRMQQYYRASAMKEPPCGSRKRSSMTNKAAYDLAFQTDGKTLPVTFKFGTDESPVYHTFDELADFYTKAVKHIQEMLENGWKNKDAIDLSKYNA